MKLVRQSSSFVVWRGLWWWTPIGRKWSEQNWSDMTVGCMVTVGRGDIGYVEVPQELVGGGMLVVDGVGYVRWGSMMLPASIMYANGTVVGVRIWWRCWLWIWRSFTMIWTAVGPSGFTESVARIGVASSGWRWPNIYTNGQRWASTSRCGGDFGSDGVPPRSGRRRGCWVWRSRFHTSGQRYLAGRDFNFLHE